MYKSIQNLVLNVRIVMCAPVHNLKSIVKLQKYQNMNNMKSYHI